ncbi:hypothetical protein [Mycobacteroides abscessus]|uniref:hypothetical protein n=1 Tax=Mycobacteroides abscessus TaxID=36809 RepID=UPI00030F1A0B|nr:hypothetical protein [Mycobacteroides abscessus]
MMTLPKPHPTNDGTEASQAYQFVWDIEDRFIGALMSCTAAEIRTLAAIVRPTDIYRPTPRWAYELIVHLALAGIDPNDPRNIIAAAHHHAPSDYHTSDIDLAEKRPHLFVTLCRYLVDVYATGERESLICHTRELLDESFRRTNEQWSVRQGEMSRAVADRQDIRAMHLAMRQDLADIWNRCETAAAITDLSTQETTP